MVENRHLLDVPIPKLFVHLFIYLSYFKISFLYMIFVSVKKSASYIPLSRFLSDQDPAKLNPWAFLNS